MGEGCQLWFFKLCIKKKKQVVISNSKRKKEKKAITESQKAITTGQGKTTLEISEIDEYRALRTGSSIAYPSNSLSFHIYLRLAHKCNNSQTLCSRAFLGSVRYVTLSKSLSKLIKSFGGPTMSATILNFIITCFFKSS